MGYRHEIPACVIDPEGVERRKRRRLKRRRYSNPGPNFLWHVDGWDKLALFGFFIHEAVDGFSVGEFFGWRSVQQKRILELLLRTTSLQCDNLKEYPEGCVATREQKIQ